MEQYALLFKNKSNLEIYVTDHGQINNGGFIGDIPFNNSRQVILGIIRFESEKNSQDILKQFGKKYLGYNSFMRQAQDLWYVLNYPINFEPTIIKAFVNYFSKENI